jgi:sec-independent protein translocase protein TatC
MPEPKFNREDYKNQENNRNLSDIDAADKSSAVELSEHLEELRNRIFISLIVFVLLVMLCFHFSESIILVLESCAPKGSSFFQIKPGELFMTSLKVAVYFGFCFSLPVIFWQGFLFMRPGLKDNEKHLLAPLVILAPVLFWLGQIFAYFLVLPPLIEFLFKFRENIVETRYSLEHFLNLVISLLSMTGVSFLLPLIILMLGICNLVSSKQLLSIWRYVVLGAFVLSAIITPTPDPFTMSILASALLSLYFLTVIILKIGKK